MPSSVGLIAESTLIREMHYTIRIPSDETWLSAIENDQHRAEGMSVNAGELKVSNHIHRLVLNSALQFGFESKLKFSVKARVRQKTFHGNLKKDSVQHGTRQITLCFESITKSQTIQTVCFLYPLIFYLFFSRQFRNEKL